MSQLDRTGVRPAVEVMADPEISVVMLCLNEEESIAHCVSLALEGIQRSGLSGEVIVYDTGPSDQSVERAKEAGRRDQLLDWIERDFSLERGLVAGGLIFLGGLLIDILLLVHWIYSGLGEFNAMPQALYAMSLMMIGAHTAFAAFFLSLFADGSVPRRTSS